MNDEEVLLYAARKFRARAIMAAVAFLAAGGRIDDAISGDVIPTREEIMNVANDFALFMAGATPRDFETLTATHRRGPYRRPWQAK